MLCLTDHPPQSAPLDKFLHVCLTLFPSLHTPEYSLPFHSIFQNTRPSFSHGRRLNKQTLYPRQSFFAKPYRAVHLIASLYIHRLYFVKAILWRLNCTQAETRLHSRAPPPIKVILKYFFIHGLMNPSLQVYKYNAWIIIFINVSQIPELSDCSMKNVQSGMGKVNKLRFGELTCIY